MPIVRVALLLMLVTLFSLLALAQQPTRLALLIGNQNYSEKVGPLNNPHHDVALIEASLQKLGFLVTVLNDADYRTMNVAFNQYVRQLHDAGAGAVGFFYYSGHGAANADTKINYLIPVDVVSAEDNSVWDQSFQQDQIIDLMSKQASNATQFVVFDACRNQLNLPSRGKKGIGSDKGFVPVGNAPGLLIAYATAPNRTASDVGEGGGPYAKVLADELLKPGVEAVTMFRNVQIRVKQTIGQDPWLSVSSLEPVYLAGRPSRSEPANPSMGAEPQAPMAPDAQAWITVQNSSSEAVLEQFVKGFPSSVYTRFAKARLDELRRAKTASNEESGSSSWWPWSSGKRQESQAMPAGEKSRTALAVPKPAPSETACDDLLVTVATGPSPCVKPGSGQSFRDCPDCPEMVVIPAGSFLIGSPPNEGGRSGSEDPQHKVRIKSALAVGKYAVTFAEWDACLAAGGCGGYRPSDEGWGRGDRPVINVNWNNAKAYTAWLSKKTGSDYRLLSEAEREYATRAGTSSPFWFGPSITPDNANYNANFTYGGPRGEFLRKTLPVNSFSPNPWGLYQVHGNVWEWTEDCWHDNYMGAPAEASAWTEGECLYRVIRGGAWSFNPRFLRAAARSDDSAANRNSVTGLRVARKVGR